MSITLTLRQTFQAAAALQERINVFLPKCEKHAQELRNISYDENFDKIVSIESSIEAIKCNLEFAYVDNHEHTIEMLERLQEQTGLEL